MCSGRVSSSCSTSDIRRVNLVTNPVIKKRMVMYLCVRGIVFVTLVLYFILELF
jgi:hypothetical protein